MRSTPNHNVLIALLACVLPSLCVAFLPREFDPSQSVSNVPTAASIDRQLEEAHEAFHRALSLLPSDHAAGVELAREAAARYRGISLNQGISNHLLELNVGNSYMLCEDLGRAVLAYKRAERLAPGDQRVRQSLRNARAKIGVIAPSDTQGKWFDAVSAWPGLVRRDILLAALVACYVGGWVAAITARYRSHRIVRFAGVTLGTVFVALAALLGVAEWQSPQALSAVVVQSGAVGLNGPAVGVYEPTYKAPLAAGMECVVLETRGSWVHVRLLDGTTTWLVASAVELV